MSKFTTDIINTFQSQFFQMENQIIRDQKKFIDGELMNIFFNSTGVHINYIKDEVSLLNTVTWDDFVSEYLEKYETDNN